jgi:hypothetical protein
MPATSVVKVGSAVGGGHAGDFYNASSFAVRY